MEEKKKTVYQILESVCDRFCKEYCKHSDTIDAIKDEVEIDAKIEELCANCPLNDII